ncbi:MAG: hypothetical protein M4579_004264 [Chaenotheca gracillima]|nr:MAG: hypothetical protein M4579_004264 [Chaenotheca gracillima]
MSYSWKSPVYQIAQTKRPSSVGSSQGQTEPWLCVEPSSPMEAPSTPCMRFDRRASLASSRSWETGLSIYSSESSAHSPCTPIQEQAHGYSPIDLCFPEGEEILDHLTPIRSTAHCAPVSTYGYEGMSFPTLSKGLFTSQDTNVVPFPLYQDRSLSTGSSSLDMSMTPCSSQESYYDLDRGRGSCDSMAHMGTSESSMACPGYLSTVVPSETYTMQLDAESCLPMGFPYVTSNGGYSEPMDGPVLSDRHSAGSPELGSPSKSISNARSRSTRLAHSARKRRISDAKSQRCIKDKRLDLLRKGYTFTISKQGTYNCEVEGCKSPPFKREEHKKRHMKTTHSGEKPWKCGAPGCTKDFSRSDNRTQHYKTHVFPKRNAAVPDEHPWWDDKRDTLAKIRREEAEGRM